MANLPPLRKLITIIMTDSAAPGMHKFLFLISKQTVYRVSCGRMNYGSQSRDFIPMGKIGNFPIHMVTVIVAIHVVFMIAGAVYGKLPGLLAFSSLDVLDRFSIWELFTYPLVHHPGIWFLVGMLFLYWFGKEVESFVGRKAFLTAYVSLVLSVSFSATLIGLATPVEVAGASLPHLGVFLLFALVYPNVEMFLRIKIKWIAFALIGIHLLQDISVRNWPGVILLAVTCMASVEIARRLGIGSAVNIAEKVFAGNPRPRQPRVPEKMVRKKKISRPKKRSLTVDNTDAILDKIARSGISSLTADERAELEKARKKLLQKDSR